MSLPIAGLAGFCAIALGLSGAGLAFSGCATTSAGASDAARPRIEMDAIVISPSEDPLTGLEAYDARELLALARQKFQEGDYDRAAKVNERLLTMFPDSELVEEAMFGAALAYEQLAEVPQAIGMYERLLVRDLEPSRKKDLQFRWAIALAKVGRWSEVADTFWALRQSGRLAALEEIEARVGQGVAMFMQNDFATAEHEFRGALDFHAKTSKEEFLPAEYWLGQARFYLGEIYARAFEAKVLTAPPGIGEGEEDRWADALGAELEEKCQLLLRAQNNFIRAIRVGHVGWATASGYRIGSLYERLYDDLVKVPVPAGLDGEERDVYLGELRNRVSVLVVKAIKVYELSLETAKRVGEKNEWVDRTHASLERMKSLYLEVLGADG